MGKYIDAVVNGEAARLDVMRETPTDDGRVEVLVLVPGGARRIVVDVDDVKTDEGV